MLDSLPILEVCMGILGFGLSIMFCTTICKVCGRLREEQIEREVQRRSEHDGRPPSIYFIPFNENRAQQSSDVHPRLPRYSQELPMPPHPAVYCGPPPSYNELGIKPDELPPAYTEYIGPVYPITPPPHIDTVQPQIQSQQDHHTVA